MIPTRQTAAFPEVAIIRKGKPKVKGQPKNGKDTWNQGPDLKDKFRVHFLPGTGEIEPGRDEITGKLKDSPRSIFHKKFVKNYVQYGPNFNVPDGYELKEIRAMIPFGDAFNGWRWHNEAYNAGQRIAQADDDFYIEKKDPITHQFTVRNGEPKEAFHVGDTINYTRTAQDGKTYDYSIPVKFHGNLRVYLPEVEQFVSFTLKTTSFYDRTTIEPNLGAIQELANMLNGGISGGIPFFMYRAQKDVAWNHKDGSVSRTKIWSVFLRIDEEWVKTAMKRLSHFALTGEQLAGLLQAPDVELQGEVNPADETFDDENTVEATFIPEEEPVVVAPAKPYTREQAKADQARDSRMWTVAQKQVLIDHKLADNDFAAKGMLGLSNLPADATEAEILQWGTIYRTCRNSIDPSTGKKHLAPVAAAFADEEMLALKVAG